MKTLFKDNFKPASMRINPFYDEDEDPDESKAIQLKLKQFSESNQVLINRYISARHYFDTINSLQLIAREGLRDIGIYEDETADRFIKDMLYELSHLEEAEASLRQFLASYNVSSAHWLAARMMKTCSLSDRDECTLDCLQNIEEAISKVNQYFITYLWNTLEQIPNVPYFSNINVAKMVKAASHKSSFDIEAPLEDNDYVIVATNIVRQLRIIARLIALTLYENRAQNKAALDQVLHEGTLLHSIVHNEKYNRTAFEAVTSLLLKYTSSRTSDGCLISIVSHEDEFMLAYTTHASYSAMRLYCTIIQNDLDIATATHEIEIALVSFFAQYLRSSIAYSVYEFEQQLATLFHPETLAVADIIRKNIINSTTPPNELKFYKMKHDAKINSERVQRIVEQGGTRPVRGWSEDTDGNSKLKAFAMTALNVISFPLQLFGMVAGFCLSIALGILNAGIAIVSMVLIFPIFIIHTILRFIFGPPK